ncbi:MAG: peroxidase-related enzyme [Hyphomonadaceae bacterium]|jgi:uncharacterized peroxidase-related enzyme|nr:peroxidase-related enzyme [Hyphomonadaceae bacterium]
MIRKPKLMALEPGPQDDLEPQVAEYFQKCEEKLGFVPNVFRAYAFDNVKLKAFIQMADDLMLGDSGLSKTEREMIAVTVSAINHCHYCLTSHGAALRQRGKDPELGEVIAQNYRAAGLDRRQKAMLDFASKLTETPDKIEESDRAALRQAGFSDRDIWDIAAVAGFYNMSNRLAAAADIRPNREYHYWVREPLEAAAPVPIEPASTRAVSGRAPGAASASPRRRSNRGG